MKDVLRVPKCLISVALFICAAGCASQQSSEPSKEETAEETVQETVTEEETAAVPAEDTVPEAVPDKSIPASEKFEISQEMQTGGMGFEGEILPYTEGEPDYSKCDDSIKEMPLLMKDISFEGGYPKRVDTSQMDSVLGQLAALFHEHVLSREEYYFPNGGIESINVKTETMTISMDSQETAVYFFNEPKVIDSSYSLDPESNAAEATATMKYLMEYFGDVISFKQAEYAPFEAFTYDGNIIVSYYTYEGAGSGVDRRLAVLFDRVQFGGMGNKVDMLRIFAKPDYIKDLGNFPIIPVKDAVDLYKKGIFRTTYTGELTDQIVSGELLYYETLYEKMIMPYYRFLVKLPADEYPAKDGFIQTAAVWVPALEPSYYVFETDNTMPFN